MRQRQVHTDAHANSRVNGRRWLRRIPMFIVLATCLVAISYLMTTDVRQPIVVVDEISASGSDTEVVTVAQQPEYYQSTVRAALQDSSINYLKPFVQKSSIESMILAEHPEIARVSVGIAIIERRPVVRLLPRVAEYMFLDQSGQSFMVDQTGVLFSDTSSSSIDVNVDVPVLNDQISEITSDQIGTQVVPRSTLRFIEQLQFQLTTHGEQIPVEQYILPLETQELHLQFTDQDYIVKFDLAGDSRMQAGALFALIEQLHEANRLPDEYIDVRISGRAYYR